MKFEDLDYILTIFEEKQISKAAERLYISQPALSRRLKKLEESINAKLFERKKNECVPTQLGLLYIDFAKQLLILRANFDKKLQKEGFTNTLSFGITPSRSTTLTPYVLKQFTEKFPLIKISIIEGTVKKLESLFNEKKLDVIFTTSDTTETIEKYELISKEEIVLTVKKNSLLAKQIKSQRKFPWIDLKEVSDRTFIVLKDSTRLGQITPKIFKNNHISPSTLIVDSIDTAQQLAINNLGVCLCSDLNVISYDKQLDIFSFGETPFEWYFIAEYHYLTEPIKYLIHLYKQSQKSLSLKDKMNTKDS